MGGRRKIQKSSSRGRSRGKIRSSSRGRRNVKQVEKAEEDRISNLPDDLINHILSYVHSNVAVQTMVLSKRWLNLWTTLSCLNFKPPVFSIHDSNILIEILKVGCDNYENLVTNFLKNRDEQFVLSKFKIDGDLGGVEMLTICLDYVRSHKVEYLSIRSGNLVEYPCLFNSACLKTSLASLYLEKVRIGKHVLEFENLKELTLGEICRIDGDDMNITINCPKLQSLTLYPDLQHTFFVSAPSLLYFSYCSSEISGFFAERDGFPCIKQVHIGIKKDNGYFIRCYSWTVMKHGMDNFVSMLKAVRKTPFLELSSETIEGLQRVPSLSEYEHSSLDNVKVLSLRGGAGLLNTRAARTATHVTNYLLANSPQAKIIRKL